MYGEARIVDFILLISNARYWALAAVAVPAILADLGTAISGVSGNRTYKAKMTRNPKIKLSLLRDIGWELWDPIGLGLPGEGWPEDCADEYDSYLLQVVGMLNQGKSSEEAIEYLDWVRAEHMGMGPSTDVTRQACAATVQAITAYLQTLPDDPLSVR
ncbi:MAG: hypothetical protein CFE37_10860 [Alphaproteobacteria bacterium PA4]|nr:MAG: hypothetical protein CFE37_10860 [Alphaproteobacteria bacterium PA4]